jgi:N-carbamoylputrescine amidase
LSASIPTKVAADLGIPVVFANQCGETRTTIPVLGTQIKDRFAGKSSICDGLHAEPVIAGNEPNLLIAPITLHQRGMISWRSTFPSVPAASSSDSALS